MVKKQTARRSFWSGVGKGLPIVIGYLPISLSFGVISAQTGLSRFHTVLMSVIVYAGASQFMAVNMMLLGAAGFEIVLATFILNLRHFVMSISFINRYKSLEYWSKMGLALGLTDETFAMAFLATETEDDPNLKCFLSGMMLAAYGSWVGGSFLGWTISLVIPASIGESMEIALYAMFIGLLIPAVKKNFRAGLIAVLGGLLNVFLHRVVGLGWGIVLATVFAAGFGVLFLEE